MIADFRQITARHWQPRLGHDGEVVEGLDDIAQCIAIILSTPKGSDPHRPEFGSDIWRYIDWPVDRARPHVVREAIEAIARWETRCEVLRVEVLPGNGRLAVRVTWRIAGGEERTTEVSP